MAGTAAMFCENQRVSERYTRALENAAAAAAADAGLR